jgi:hypothetical protein
MCALITAAVKTMDLPLQPTKHTAAAHHTICYISSFAIKAVCCVASQEIFYYVRFTAAAASGYSLSIFSFPPP